MTSGKIHSRCSKMTLYKASLHEMPLKVQNDCTWMWLDMSKWHYAIFRCMKCHYRDKMTLGPDWPNCGLTEMAFCQPSQKTTLCLLTEWQFFGQWVFGFGLTKWQLTERHFCSLPEKSYQLSSQSV